MMGGGISSIARDTSDIMKGILALLIILGHNSILTHNIAGLYDYLYSFHVLIFFILPWFYTAEPPTIAKITKRSGKIWFWYITFFIIQAILYNLLFKTTFSPLEAIKAIFLGGHTLLKGVTGYMYLWFMPAFFFSMLVRDAYTIAPKKNRYAMIAISLIVVTIFAFYSYTNQIALIQGIYFAGLGIIASLLKLPKRKIERWLIVLLFAICSALIFAPSIKDIIYPFMPFIAFLALWSIIEADKKYLRWLIPIGQISMFIYLTHPLIFQLLLRIVPDYYSSIAYGLIIFALTTIMSIIVSWCIQKVIKSIPIVRKYI